MAGRAHPSFLKRQKEQKRAAKAVQKRAAQQARRDKRAAGIDDDVVSLDELMGAPEAEESEASAVETPADGDDKPDDR